MCYFQQVVQGAAPVDRLLRSFGDIGNTALFDKLSQLIQTSADAAALLIGSYCCCQMSSEPLLAKYLQELCLIE